VGSIGLDLRVVGPRQVDVKWNAVTERNGDVMYDVYFEGLEYVDPGKQGCRFTEMLWLLEGLPSLNSIQAL
jgi:hypothetical protein